jgi:8-oxo-dGTP pyrophosphatase MutT (NUDIX family)
MSIPMDLNRIKSSLPALILPVAIPPSDDHLMASAVMILVHYKDEQWHIVFTTRARHLNNHAGQISFPGGRFDETDQHLLQTAVRETKEEIGLDDHYIDAISQLKEYTTLTGFRIFPYVAIVENLPSLTIDASEVDDVFSVPLTYLLDKKNHQIESLYYKEKEYDYYKILWKDRVIWGATAKMIVDLSHYFT